MSTTVAQLYEVWAADSALRDDAGGERQVLAEGGTVREVLDDLAGRFPALGARILDNGGIAPFVNVYLGGEDVRTRDGYDTAVEPGDTVILLPAMAGGSAAESAVHFPRK